MAFGSITAALILVETGDLMSRCLTRKFGGPTRSECRLTAMMVGMPLAVIGLFLVRVGGAGEGVLAVTDLGEFCYWVWVDCCTGQVPTQSTYTIFFSFICL